MLVIAMTLAMAGTTSTMPAGTVRQEQLSETQGAQIPGTKGSVSCTSGRRWCANLEENSGSELQSYMITVQHAGSRTASVSLADVNVSSSAGISLWGSPVSYRTSAGRDGFLFGVITSKQEGYSGGGAEASSLQLFRAETDSSGGLNVEAMGDAILMGASALIRACFGEDLVKLRRNMCHDDYQLDVSVKLQPRLVNDLPAFLYVSNATVTPGFATRDQDNSDRTMLRNLKPRDFKTRTDARCTFTRTLQADETRKRYVLDSPDCSDYGVTQE